MLHKLLNVYLKVDGRTKSKKGKRDMTLEIEGRLQMPIGLGMLVLICIMTYFSSKAHDEFRLGFERRGSK